MKHDKSVRFVLLFALLLSLSINAFSQGSDEIVSPAVRVNAANQKSPQIVGLTPAEVRRAYGFDRIVNQGAGQTIAIVVAFDNPAIQNDLDFFTSTFDLPPCNPGNGCFYKAGNPPPPDPAIFPDWFVQLWQLEGALDVEWAHAVAPQARKVLVQADTAFLTDLLKAVKKAISPTGASVVSMSWGLPETRDRSRDFTFVKSNVSFVAASGDTGNPGLWPATSSDVTAVGGTKLNTNAGGSYSSENSWSESGGGQSTFVFAAGYQLPFTFSNPSGKRGVPDVAYDADPQTGFAVYSSLFGGSAGWSEVAGTSAGPPQWSGLIAIVNSMRSAAGKSLFTGFNRSVYSAATTSYGAFNDVSSGPNNGQCGAVCKVGPGYDYVTGLGTPKANALIQVLADLP